MHQDADLADGSTPEKGADQPGETGVEGRRMQHGTCVGGNDRG